MTHAHPVFCDCTGAPPWPVMQRINVAGPHRYYLCRQCGHVREEVCRTDGTIISTRFREAYSQELPEAAREQARDILEQPSYRQLSLFPAT
jgi:hypothetical protein